MQESLGKYRRLDRYISRMVVAIFRIMADSLAQILYLYAMLQ